MRISDWSSDVCSSDRGATLGLMLSAGVALPGTANAATIAYEVVAGTPGIQDYAGSLGMDFNVVQDINVIDLGVFDASSAGLNRAITAQLWNRLTQTVEIGRAHV